MSTEDQGPLDPLAVSGDVPCPKEPKQADAAPDLVPARMLNEFTYCPRLFYLEWVQREFEDNYFTVHGRSVHRRSDDPSGTLAAPEELDAEEHGEAPLLKLRSLEMSSEREGLIAKIDVLEVEGGAVEPVEFKRGAPPDVPEGAWEPERVQVCAQALILRDHGYRCERGWIFFAGARQRIEVPIDEALVARTRELLAGLRRTAAAGTIPPPLVADPKCEKCSLNAICLPDEVHFLAAAPEEGDVHAPEAPRRLLTPRVDALPLYVQEQGTSVGISGEVLVVRDRQKKTLAEARLEHTSQVCLFGAVQISTQAIRELMTREIPVFFFNQGGWFHGRTEGIAHKNIELRIAQFRAAEDAQRTLAIARSAVATKILNSRTLLRRNHPQPPAAVLRELRALAGTASRAGELATLLGLEGTAARTYFAHFGDMLRGHDAADGRPLFHLEGRSRRPPRDPVNALLSFTYALLTKDCTLAALSAGLDPYLGFYHQPRYGRPALALDLMEEFRPLIAESVVLSVINTRTLTLEDFFSAGIGVALRPHGRRRLIQAYERRMDELVTHPVFKYQLSYRRVLTLQARLLGRYLLGEFPRPPRFRTR